MILFNRTTEIIENPDDRWAKMKNKENLDYIYKQNLEEFIIEYLSKEKNLELRQAMDIYYHSRLNRGHKE